MNTALPSILILAEEAAERGRIIALVEAAGLRPLPASTPKGARAVLDRSGCQGAVIALSDPMTRGFAIEACRIVPNVLAVLDDHAAPIDDPSVITVRRPLKQRELLEAILALALGGDAADALGDAPGDAGSHHASVAEFGLGAAKLACMAMREAEAVASSASRLIRELSLHFERLGAPRSGNELATTTGSA